MKSFAKKFLSIALAAVLLLSVFPMAAMAAGKYTVEFIVGKESFTVPTTDDNKVDKSSTEYQNADNAAKALANKGKNGELLGWKFQKGGKDAILADLEITGENIHLVPRYAAATTPCEHKNTEEKITKNATCTATGLKNIVCADCGEIVEKDVTIPMTDHKYDVKGGYPSTCKKQGESWMECACGKIDESTRKTLALADHTWGDWVVTKAATATAEGVETRKCTECGETDTRAIPKTDDAVQLWKITFDENLPSEYKNSTKTTYEVKADQRLGTLFGKGALPLVSCNRYVFKGWYLCDEDGDITNVHVTSETIYDYNRNVTVKAKWAAEARVKLILFRNGNTSTPIDTVQLYGYSVGDVIYTKDLDIKEYYKNGNKAFKWEGWFDREGWTLFKAKDNAKPITSIKTVDLDGTTTLFCMIYDDNAPASKNPDHTNPKTGDESMIIATTAVMLVSAGALAIFFMDRKRRNG